MSFFTKIFGGGNKTFKPLKPQKGEKQKELSEYARTTLGNVLITYLFSFVSRITFFST